MKYGIIGAGAMGVRYGVMLQENAGVDVDFIDTWEPNVEKSANKAAFQLPVITQTAESFPSTSTIQKNIKDIQMFGLSLKSRCS